MTPGRLYRHESATLTQKPAPESTRQSVSNEAQSGYPFDHAVINVRDALDDAVNTFSGLGFCITPRGFHTLGSINHLMIFGTTYIELIGFPANSPSVRAELSAAKIGLNGLVFRSTDAQASGEAARARGAPVGQAQQFSRPVDLRADASAALRSGTGSDAGNWPDAIFRTARAEPGFGPGGRLYFCEHLTPELVWRDDWRTHPNSAVELSRVFVETDDLQRTERQFAQLLGERAVHRAAGTVTINAAPVVVEVRQGERELMRGVRIKVKSLAQTRDCLSRLGVAFSEQPASTLASGQAVLTVSATQAGAVEFEFAET